MGAYLKNPKELVLSAWKDNKETGSSTVVVLALDQGAPVIRSALIGDSGYMILRPNEADPKKLGVVFRSTEQQHSFNFPFQIGSQGDHPSCAETKTHEVKSGDIVVLGTDGLFDNLFDDNVVKEMETFLDKHEFSAEKLAEKIAALAYKRSLDTKWVSPFAVGARKSRYNFVGGKSDDITVVVGRVVAN